MNEIAALLEIPCLAPGCDCCAWLPVFIGDAEIDYCVVCGESASDHPADAFDEDEEDVG